MEEPFEYIKELQAEFDYNSIKFSEWKVYFDGNFWGHHGRERAGKEIFIRKQFTWGETMWYIPTIYACSKGLVIDFCVQIPVECIRAFMEKWSLAIESDVSDFTNEKVMKIEAENPMSIRMNPEIVLNDKIISASHGSKL